MLLLNGENYCIKIDNKEVVGINSGLGLHLIRDLAKAIDCQINVDTKIGLGTTILLAFEQKLARRIE